MRHQGKCLAAAVGAVLMLSPAYAFNPQPDPPARILTRIDAHAVLPGPCKDGTKCLKAVQGADAFGDGLLADGAGSHAAPGSTGTPLAIGVAGHAGAARAAAIR